MATYQSVGYLNSPNSFQGATVSGGMLAFYFEVPITTALTTSDAINFGVVPKGFRLLGGCLESTDMDSGTTVTLNVGDSGSATRLFSAATVAQAATADRAMLIAGQHYLYTSDTVITGVAAAGPATTTGTLYLSLYGRFEGSAS